MVIRVVQPLLAPTGDFTSSAQINGHMVKRYGNNASILTRLRPAQINGHMVKRYGNNASILTRLRPAASKPGNHSTRDAIELPVSYMYIANFCEKISFLRE